MVINVSVQYNGEEVLRLADALPIQQSQVTPKVFLALVLSYLVLELLHEDIINNPTIMELNFQTPAFINKCIYQSLRACCNFEVLHNVIRLVDFRRRNK